MIGLARRIFPAIKASRGMAATSGARHEFREIIAGWTLVGGVDDLAERIDRVAAWSTINGPLLADENRVLERLTTALAARRKYCTDEEN